MSEAGKLLGACNWCGGSVYEGRGDFKCLEPETDYKVEVVYHEDCLTFGKHLDPRTLGWKQPDIPADTDPVEYYKKLQEALLTSGENTLEAVERAKAQTREFMEWVTRRNEGKK